MIRQQIDQKHRPARVEDAFAQRRRQRINRAAFDAMARDHAFAAQRSARRAFDPESGRLEWVTRPLRDEALAPSSLETAVAWQQGRHRYAAPFQDWHPGAVRAQARPAAAAQRKDRRVRPDMLQPHRGLERQLARIAPAEPPVSHMKAHARRAQPVNPGTQQGGGLHFAREHPTGASHERFDAQPVNPFAQRPRVELRKRRLHLRAARAIAAGELVKGLGMGDVQPATTRHQELAGDRWFPVEEVHKRAGRGKDFGGRKAGRPAADDGDRITSRRRHSVRRLALKTGDRERRDGKIRHALHDELRGDLAHDRSELKTVRRKSEGMEKTFLR